MLTVVLLLASNIFMTFAWYGHLRFKEISLPKVILISWFIAFFEYCLMVPANRYGHGQFSAVQLKIIQEVITVIVFSGFAVTFLGESVRLNHVISFGFLVGAVYFSFGR